MVRQEKLIIDILLDAHQHGKRVLYWDLVEKVVRQYLNPGDRLRDGSVEVVALFNRLMRERKVTRDRRNYECHIKLTDVYAEQLGVTSKPTGKIEEKTPRSSASGGVYL